MASASAYFADVIKYEPSMVGRAFRSEKTPIDSILYNEIIAFVKCGEDYTRRYVFSNHFWEELYSLSFGAANEIKSMPTNNRLLAVRDYAQNYFILNMMIKSFPAMIESAKVSNNEKYEDISSSAIHNMKEASSVNLLNMGEDEMKIDPLIQFSDAEELPNSVKLLFLNPNNYFEIPDDENFFHTRDFAGGSQFKAFVIMKGKTAQEVSEIFNAVKTWHRNRGDGNFSSEGVPDMVPSMEFVLIRYASALSEIGNSIRLPLIEEIFYRKFGNYTSIGQSKFVESSSDYRGGVYRLYKLDRSKFIGNYKFYLTEVKNDDPVFYGLSTDVPHQENRLVVTMRGSCTDCHASSAPSWGSVLTVAEPFKVKNDPVQFERLNEYELVIRYAENNK
ncbi:MAG: hypothetical protein QM680_02515 [Luteolibacter sp.]